MDALFVVTEHPEFLDPTRVRRYERVRARLEVAAGEAVTSRHYYDLGTVAKGALVLSGSSAPWSAHEDDRLERLGDAVRSFRGPVLGICAGMQLQAKFAGGGVGRCERPRQPGYAPVEVLDAADLFRGLPNRFSVYKHHTDEIVRKPPSFRVLARSRDCSIEAVADGERPWWGTQFHPEEFRSRHPVGERVLENFFQLARSV